MRRVLLALALWAAASSLALAYLLFSSPRAGEISIDIGIGYGNGTVVWFNGTRLQEGSTLLDATEAVAEVEYSSYPMGAFVESINGVENSHPYYWMWWYWDGSSWREGPVAADRYALSDGDVVFWLYEDTSVSPLRPPPG